MIRAYSQRLLPPYTGTVQIAESPSTRAQSFDGIYWEIHYLPGADPSQTEHHRVPGYALDRSFHKVAHWTRDELKTYIIPGFLDAAFVNRGIEEVAAFLATAEPPFAPADLFEFWLLDALEQKPLALMYSCCDESQMSSIPSRAEWTAVPHSKMAVANSEGETARGEPPVNHRLQRTVARRAGAQPKSAWVKREAGSEDDFPRLLLREDWNEGEDQDLCERYLARQSTRLLMLHNLGSEARDRMEQAAKAHVFEVEEYRPMYPAVHDERRMKAMLVEARLRRSTPETTRKPTQKKDDKPSEFSKDMRIIEN